MPNSQKQNEGLKNTFKSLAWWLGFAAKFMPSPLKVWALLASTLLGGVVAIMNDCDVKQNKKDTPSTNTTQSPTPKTKKTEAPFETPTPCKDAWCF